MFIMVMLYTTCHMQQNHLVFLWGFTSPASSAFRFAASSALAAVFGEIPGSFPVEPMGKRFTNGFTSKWWMNWKTQNHHQIIHHFKGLKNRSIDQITINRSNLRVQKGPLFWHPHSSTFQCNCIKNCHAPWTRCLHYCKLWISIEWSHFLAINWNNLHLDLSHPPSPILSPHPSGSSAVLHWFSTSVIFTLVDCACRNSFSMGCFQSGASCPIGSLIHTLYPYTIPTCVSQYPV